MSQTVFLGGSNSYEHAFNFQTVKHGELWLLAFSRSRWEGTAGTLWWNTSSAIVPADRQRRDCVQRRRRSLDILARGGAAAADWAKLCTRVSPHDWTARYLHVKATHLALCLKPPVRIRCLNFLLKVMHRWIKALRGQRAEQGSGSLCSRWPREVGEWRVFTHFL